MRWPKKRMRLWHPDSPGVRIDVWVRWPRYLFDPAFATIHEVVRERPVKMSRCISCGETLTTDWVCVGCLIEGARRETEHWNERGR